MLASPKFALQLVLCLARPEARSWAKPSQNRLGPAGPKSQPATAFGLAWELKSQSQAARPQLLADIIWIYIILLLLLNTYLIKPGLIVLIVPYQILPHGTHLVLSPHDNPNVETHWYQSIVACGFTLNLFYPLLGPHHGILEKLWESSLVSGTLRPQPKYTYEQPPSHRYGRSIAMPIPPSLDVEDPSLWPHWITGYDASNSASVNCAKDICHGDENRVYGWCMNHYCPWKQWRYQCYWGKIWVSCWFNVLDVAMWWLKIGIGRSQFEGSKWTRALGWWTMIGEHRPCPYPPSF